MFTITIITVSSFKLVNREEADNRSWLERFIDFLFRIKYVNRSYFIFEIESPDYFTIEVDQKFRDSKYNHYVVKEKSDGTILLQTEDLHFTHPGPEPLLIRI